MRNQRGQIGEAKNQRFFLALLNQKPKKGQVGDTITWVVATIVIVVILGLSVFAATLSPIKSSKEFRSERKADLLATKSLINYLSSKESREVLYIKLREGGKIGESSKKIVEYYERDYTGSSEIYIKDKFEPPIQEVGGDVKCGVEIKVDLGNEKEVLLCLGSQ